jgi:hypothetical protein
MSGANVGRAILQEVSMDLVFLLILAGLYLITHGLVWAFTRLAKTS